MASKAFASLKKSKGKNLQSVMDKVNKMSSGGGNTADERLWKPTLDKAGNGEAVIRFLPAPDGEQDEIVRMFSHFFKGPKGWYVENSLTTIGQDDPCGELNQQLWAHGEGTPERRQASNQKRNLKYYSNIYVISDKGNPDNEGKVFLFEYGKMIFDRINDAMHPKFSDETPVDPFDMWEGANFKMRIYSEEKTFGNPPRKVAVPQYDKCIWEKCELGSDDTEREEIYEQCHSLAAIVAPDKFKSYDELKNRLEKVLGLNDGGHRSVAATIEEEERTSTTSYEEEEAETPPWDDGDDDSDTDSGSDKLKDFRSMLEDDDD